jgi:hypothetical protein
MKHRLYIRNILISMLVLSAFSCSSDLDFDQANDLTVQPVFTTNLAYLEAKASNFVINGSEQPLFSYISSVDFFSSSFVENDLVKTDLYFRIKNTITRAYALDITFLDKNNAPIYTIPTMNVAASTGAEELFETTETFTPANVSVLKNTTKMIFSIKMLPGPPLTATSLGRIEFSSSITAYFDVK